MKRRKMLLGAAAGAAGLALPRIGAAQSAKVLKFIPQADLAAVDPIFSPALVTISVLDPFPVAFKSLVPVQVPELSVRLYVVPVLMMPTFWLVPSTRFNEGAESVNVANICRGSSNSKVNR